MGRKESNQTNKTKGLYFRIPTIYHWIYLCPVIAVSHAMIIACNSFWPLFAANLLYGVSFGVTMAQAPAIMLEVSGLARYPRAIALMNVTYGIGDLFGGIMGGLYSVGTCADPEGGGGGAIPPTLEKSRSYMVP